MWYIYLVETMYLALVLPPRSGQDVMKTWGCIASVGGLPLSRKQACQVSHTSLICTSTQLSVPSTWCAVLLEVAAQ